MLWQLQNTVPRHRYHPSRAHLRLQQVPAHGPEHARDPPRLPQKAAEIPWQPEFDRATEVLQRSLLN